MSRAARFAVAAAACALLAAWLTLDYTGRAAQKSGPTQNVLVASVPIERGAEIGAGEQLAVRSMPTRFAPPDALAEPADAIGERMRVSLPAGAFVTRSALSGGEQHAGRFKLRVRERALTVDVVVSPYGQPLTAGDRIDLFASGYGGDQSTEALMAGAEVLDVAEGPAPDRQRPTIRITGDQVAAVVRADVFAHELRAVLRP